MKAKFLFLLTLSVFFISKVFSVDLATCFSPEGYAFFPYTGMMIKENSGWRKDKISEGIFTIQQLDDGKYDLLFFDATKSIRSARQDGGLVELVRKGKFDLTFFIYYPQHTVEVVTLIHDKEGKNLFSIYTNRGGDFELIHKSSILVGTCKFINI